jgi:ATP-dependent protease ClpP protease subunit
MKNRQSQKIPNNGEDSAESQEKTAEILIYDVIGKDWFGDGISSVEFIKDLEKIEADSLVVRINSPGGNVFEGFAIYNALKRFKGRIEVHVDALAASIASIIAMAGDEIIMGDGAYIMVHEPWSIVMGTAEDMRKEAHLLDKITGSIAAIYANKAEGDLEDIEKLMAEETWMTADEAIELGFADRKEEAKPVKASFDFSKYGFKKVLGPLLPVENKEIPGKRDIERLLTRDAGLSRSQARTLLREGYGALSGTQDAADEGDQALRDGLLADIRATIAIINHQ